MAHDKDENDFMKDTDTWSVLEKTLADGVYFNVRLSDERSCILVIIGAGEQGNKELLAVNDGYRESSLSWEEMLLDLKMKGLENLPKPAIGDGTLGFWKALDKVFPETKRPRCWVHKT